MTDWSHNYVRVPGVDEVYLTDESVLHMLYPKASYWGEKPVVVEEDGLGVDAAGEMSGAVVDTSK